MYVYIYIVHIKNYINETDNQESRFCMKDMDLTGTYHVKVTLSLKLWNDPTAGMAVLPWHFV